MSLARKTSRIINVDGGSYRWSISGARQGATGEIILVVELDETPGQRLAVLIPCRNYWIDFPQLDRYRNDIPENIDAYHPVTPARIAEIVRTALAHGWTPRTRRRPLQLRLVADGTLQQAL